MAEEQKQLKCLPHHIGSHETASAQATEVSGIGCARAPGLPGGWTTRGWGSGCTRTGPTSPCTARRTKRVKRKYCVFVCLCVCVHFVCFFFALLQLCGLAKKVGARSKMGALKQYVLARDAEPKAAPEPGHVLQRPGNGTVYKTACEVLLTTQQCFISSCCRLVVVLCRRHLL